MPSVEEVKWTERDSDLFTVGFKIFNVIEYHASALEGLLILEKNQLNVARNIRQVV